MLETKIKSLFHDLLGDFSGVNYELVICYNSRFI